MVKVTANQDTNYTVNTEIGSEDSVVVTSSVGGQGAQGLQGARGLDGSFLT